MHCIDGCGFPHTIATRVHTHSIAQRDPKMTVLILDACCVFYFDERSGEGRTKAHGLDMGQRRLKKMKEVRNTLFARACASNAEAADTGAERL